MKAYSEDLRGKIVQALRRGMGKSQAARSFGVSLSSVKRYAKMTDERRPLAPKKRPGSLPETGQNARRLLEDDLEQRPSATLYERREFPRRVCGVRVKLVDSLTALETDGVHPKKGLWERASATNS